MKKQTKFIDAGNTDVFQKQSQPSKTDGKMEWIKRGLRILQYVLPHITTKIIWHFFTMPRKPRFSESQLELIQRATVSIHNYNGSDIYSYKWGNEGPKILLAHGWGSKIADFRIMINALLEQGYVVEGVDLKAHGKSPGAHTTVPEYKDILKKYYEENAPFHAVIGYSMGGIASGIALSELEKTFTPEKLFLIAAPSHVQYFFKSAIEEIGCEKFIYNRLCAMVEEKYGKSTEYYDLNTKTDNLNKIEIHMIYEETDQMVPFHYSEELSENLKDVNFVRTKGISHYKIIVHKEVINYLVENLPMDKTCFDRRLTLEIQKCHP
ncbi:MAG: alpha/beta hydrolase [Cyclobacteriaceae bacterium]